MGRWTPLLFPSRPDPKKRALQQTSITLFQVLIARKGAPDPLLQVNVHSDHTCRGIWHMSCAVTGRLEMAASASSISWSHAAPHFLQARKGSNDGPSSTKGSTRRSFKHEKEQTMKEAQRHGSPSPTLGLVYCRPGAHAQGCPSSVALRTSRAHF